MNIVLLGAPGSGKGTQAALLVKRLGLVHVASGDLFRHHLGQKTALGDLAQGYMSRGELVPDDVTVSMIRDRLQQPDADGGVLLDGFPRTVAQAEALDAMLAEEGQRVHGAILLDVPDEELVARLAGRGRADDNSDTVRVRLEVFHRQTAPVVEHYRAAGRLQVVPGVGDVAAIGLALEHAIRSLDPGM